MKKIKRLYKKQRALYYLRKGGIAMGAFEEMREAKAEMDYRRREGGFGYKQDKRHYERVRRKFEAERRRESSEWKK